MKPVLFQHRVFQVPAWARFIAADCDGKVYAYSHQPRSVGSDNATHYFEAEPKKGEAQSEYLTLFVGRTTRSSKLHPPMPITHGDRRTPLDKQVRIQVGAFRELAMAHQTYLRSLSEFKTAVGLDALTSEQEDALLEACNADYREITQDSLMDLLKKLEAAQ